jgi:hypothetical protein
VGILNDDKEISHCAPGIFSTCTTTINDYETRSAPCLANLAARFAAVPVFLGPYLTSESFADIHIYYNWDQAEIISAPRSSKNCAGRMQQPDT